MDKRYIVVAGACLTQFTIIGLLFAYGLFFKPFEEELGWSRTLLSACTSLSFLVMGVLAMFGGYLNDRYGPRILLAGTGAATGLGYILMGYVQAPWQLLAIFGVLIGAGMGTHDVVTLSTVARWFERRRGIMTGVTKVGTAIGQMFLPLLAVALIATFGWQQALIVLGIGGGILLVAAGLMMSLPEKPAAAGAAQHVSGTRFADARRDPVMWRLCAIQFLFLPALMAVPLHIAVHGMDLGMSAPVAALLLSLIGFSSIVGRLAVGAYSDRIGGRRSFIICFTPLVLSLVSLMLFETHAALFAAVCIYGFAHGGLFTIVSPTIAEYFGLSDHGAIFGTVLFFGTLGGAAGPLLAGMAFDYFGSYLIAFASLAAMAALGLILAWTLPERRAAG